MRPLLSVRSTVFAFVFLSLLGTVNAADPVKDLEEILQFGPNILDKERMADYRKKLEKCVEAIQRPSDLRRALHLIERRVAFMGLQPGGAPEEENPLGKLYQKARGDLVKRLQDVLRKALQAKNSTRRLAAITFLAEMANDEFQKESQQGMMALGPREQRQEGRNRFTALMATDLREVLNKDKEPRVRAAAVGAVAAIDPDSEETLKDLKAFLDPQRDVLERRAAAKALSGLSQFLLKRAEGETLWVTPEGAWPPGHTPLLGNERPGLVPQPRPSRLEKSLIGHRDRGFSGLARSKTRHRPPLLSGDDAPSHSTNPLEDRIPTARRHDERTNPRGNRPSRQ